MNSFLMELFGTFSFNYQLFLKKIIIVSCYQLSVILSVVNSEKNAFTNKYKIFNM